jgi:hypothetical protein
MWLLDANMDVHLVSVLTGFKISCDTAGKRGWKALIEWRPRERCRGRRLPLPAHQGPAFWRIRFPCPKAVSAIRSRGGERPTATLAPISGAIPRTLEGTPNRASSRPVDSVAMR